MNALRDPGFIIAGKYILSAIVFAVIFKLLLKPKKELFRKTLHLVVLGFYYIWAFYFTTWQNACFDMLFIILMVLPFLLIIEFLPFMRQIFPSRKQGEFSSSFVLMGLTLITVTYVSWGVFNDRYLVILSFFAWGFGDAAAALIGKRFGKRKIGPGHLKTLEGSIAMFCFSLAGTAAALILRGGLNAFQFILVSVFVAAISTFTELYSKKGSDTFSCPVMSMLSAVYMFTMLNLI